MKGKKVLAVILAVSVMMTNGSIALAAEDTVDTGSFGQTADMSEQVIKIGEQEVPAYGEAEEDFSYMITTSGARITAYTGTDVNVSIPSSIGGYPVTGLSSTLFSNNTAVETVYIPETVTYTENDAAFYGAASLKHIYVDDGNKIFYDIDGVLFFYAADSGLPVFMKYPEAKEEASYTVTNDTDWIWSYAFYKCKYLKKIVVPLNVSHITVAGFSDLSNTTIILQQTDPSQIVLADRAFARLTNCTIIVKNEAMRDAVEAKVAGATPMYNCTNTTVKIAGDSDLDDSYRTPATSLVFADTGTATKNITLKPDSLAEQNADRFKNWNGVSDLDSAFEAGTYMDVEYAVSPADTTDSIIWESSNPGVAIVAVRNGKVRIIGAANGECTITGKDESGHTITLNVSVKIPVTGLGGWNGETVYHTYEEAMSVYEGVLPIGISIYPYNATNRSNVQYSVTGDTNTLIFNRIGEYSDGFSYYVDSGEITVKGAGTIHITANLNDDGKLFQETTTYTVTKEISSCTIGSIKDQSYTGKTVEPVITIKDGSKTLKEGTDYSVYFTNNKNVGTATAEITGIGNYTGRKTVSFKIVKAASQVSQKITGVSTSYRKAYKSSFTLKPKAKTSCTYKTSNSKIAAVNSKGKVTIKGTGKATITVTAKATSAYKSATKKITIYAIPAKMKTPTVKAGKKKLSVSWKKDSKADGYQIQYSTSSKFKKAKTVSCSKKTVKTTLKKLKSGKKYYVRIRAYKKIGSKKYYGSYSKVKNILTK